IGVPLTILGIEKNINSISALIIILLNWLKLMIFSQYPDIIVIEMGADRPGDMDYLTSIVSPDIAILTSVAYAHSEFFDDINAIANEKQKIVLNMKNDGTAIINYDDIHVRNVMNKTKKQIVSYGTQKNADFIATDIDICFHQCHTTGLSFKLNYKGKTIPVRLDHVIAQHFVYAALAGLALADTIGINIIDVIGNIASFQSSPGRMRLLDGYNATVVIDDTYNASPQSMEAAIATLHSAPGERKIAVLGDMRELGDVSQRQHQKIAQQLQKIKVDIVFLVGKEMRITYDELQGRDIKVEYYSNSGDVKNDVIDLVQTGDIILVKGSRGIYMEKIVATLVSDKTKTLSE
ncbi:MAG: UDP-N-acetylmuramoyl-tripeptide--D-alanyl-D-alanine ligase, partial [Patescibacteria group bacterium]|nr:UDP-N-acetylmuramoyl-tripeptide--D-alanyl-D-alanine ligase [Patescibacteria group bacterium]